ncbi:hypothetical protein FF011L_36400 [Roseimaritima multifibrata]|uniref:Lipoprotein n=1 Tax=Roseimaritima multifibrata TaxID=1930274 RepID=A0A517MJ25_9BACT|nr:hypothetical protein [Roseimaritima multifibrata]QDS94858.1 hypothetical protein FF011L_36400 [Roseimaritima multifibrata]
MKTRILLAVMTLMAVTSSGCCFKNALFGRGASCGPCASLGPSVNLPSPGAPCASGTCGPSAYTGESGCGCEGNSSYSPGFDGGYGNGGYETGGIIDGGVIGNGLPYSDGTGWAPRNEYVVPGSQFETQGGNIPRPMVPSTPMGSASGQ